MKKLIIITFILALTLNGCFMTHNSTSEIQIGDESVTLKNDTVYLLYEQTTTYPDGTIHKLKFDNSLTNFTCYTNENPTGTGTVEYDSKGNLIGESLDSNQTRYDLSYDEDGNLTKKVTIVNDVETYSEEYTWDNGLLVETVGKNNGQLEFRYVTTYDENRKRIQTDEYDASDALTQVSIFEHDGSKELATRYAADNTLLGYSYNTYSYADKIVKEEVYAPDGTLLYTTIRHYVPYSRSYVVTDPTK